MLLDRQAGPLYPYGIVRGQFVAKNLKNSNCPTNTTVGETKGYGSISNNSGLTIASGLGPFQSGTTEWNNRVGPPP